MTRAPHNPLGFGFDSGTGPNIYDAYHLARRGHFAGKQKGDDTSLFQFVGGCCLVIMGVRMAYAAYCKQSRNAARLGEELYPRGRHR